MQILYWGFGGEVMQRMILAISIKDLLHCIQNSAHYLTAIINKIAEALTVGVAPLSTN